MCTTEKLVGATDVSHGSTFPAPVSSQRALPFLKWAGSKRALVPELLKHVPAAYRVYHEPFVGGGALFFALRPRPASLFDANPLLARAYVAVRDRVENVIGLLRVYAERHSTEEYYRVRAVSPAHLGPPGIAAWMIYLNKTCFNGLWRVNKKGMFNVPIGDYKNPNICDEKTLRAASRALQQTELGHADFRTVEERAAAGDLVYFDPPYVPISKTANFTAYTKAGFGPKDQQDLVELARRLKQRGVHVILSNAGSDEVAQLYGKDFVIHEVEARRNINSKGGKRGAVKEYIIA
jgi:DNA adenine methylase